MRFKYKNNYYEVVELFEPNRNETFDIIAIFKINFLVYTPTENIILDGNQYDDIDAEENSDIIEKLELVDYFYGAINYEDNEEGLISECRDIIMSKEI